MVRTRDITELNKYHLLEAPMNQPGQHAQILCCKDRHALHEEMSTLQVY